MRKRVVVAGMGDTGILSAAQLSRHHDVIGIGTRPMFVSGQELGARLVRPDQWRRDYLLEYSRYRRLADVEVLHGRVGAVDLDANEVTVAQADGGTQRLIYDALVLATGTTNGFWRSAEVQSREVVERSLADASDRLRSARAIVVVGGGPSGVSVASQCADALTDASVHLFHSGAEPLPTHHPRTRRKVVRHLVAQGVQLFPGHRAIVPAGATQHLDAGTVQWSTGQTATHADIIVWTVGAVAPNSDFLPRSILDDDGFVRVSRRLLVEGRSNVFAIGDVAATDPLRSSARNFGHRILAHNVEAALSGRPARMREFAAPRHRWGSVLGLQSDGMRIHTPRGHHVLLNEPFTRRVLYPWLTHRLLYGGLRRKA